MSFRKILPIVFTLTCIFFSADKAKAQCVWDTAYYNGWNNALADTNVIAGTTYSRVPQNWIAHSGTTSLYLNLVNTLPAGSLFYNRTIPVCPGAYYQVSLYLTTTFGGTECNENVIVTDSTNNDTLAIITTGLMPHGVWFHALDSFTATSSQIHFKLVTNVGGSAYNQGGDDLSIDDLLLTFCQRTYYDTVLSCSPGTTTVFNLFDSLNPVLAAGGAWTGASILTGGSLGTFSTGTNTSGTYNYNVAGNAGCPHGLAQMLVHNYTNPSAFLGDDTTLCNLPGFVINPVISGTAPVYQTWQDGSSGTSYAATTSGSYWLKDSNICGIHSDSVTLTFMNTPVPQSIGPVDTTVCSGTVMSYALGSVMPAYDTLTWQDGTHTISYSATTPGQYNLTVSNQCGAVIDTADLHIMSAPAAFGIGPRDTTLCMVASLLLTPSPLPTGVIFIWQDGSNSSSYNATSNGLYWVKDSNMCGGLTDSINVTFMTAPIPQSIGPADTTVCPGIVITLGVGSALPAYDTLTWQDGTHNTTYQASGTGNYSLIVSNQCGSVTDTSDIQVMPPLQTSTLGPPDTTACNGATLTLGPTPVPVEVSSFLWQDGTTTTTTFSASQAGLYILRMRNLCFSIADSINMHINNAPTPFSIDGGGSICSGSTAILIANPIPMGDSLVWQDGITHTDSFVVSSAGQYTLTEINQCGTQTASAVISTLSLPSVMIDTVAVQCNKDSILLTSVATNTNTYAWNTGSVDSVIYAKTSGTYTVTASNNCGSASGSVNVELLTSPVKPFNGLVIDSCSGTQITLNAQNPGHTYEWSNGLTQQSITVTDSGVYFVTVSDNGYCPVTDSVYVYTHKCDSCKIAIPNAFTPNGDGRNDIFDISASCSLKYFKMSIYNRWGELIFESLDQGIGWDGKYKGSPQGPGIYVFLLDVTFEDGSNAFKEGSLTLLR